MRSHAGPAAAALRPRSAGKALLDALPLTIICLLPVILYLPFLAAPFERDEGVYATIAQGLLHGKVPYRDLFDNKPPLVYGWYAFSFMIFGEHLAAPRILASLLLSFTTLSIFGQARIVFSRGVAYCAAALFGLSTGLPFVALHANTEAYMLLPLATAFLAFTIGMRRSSMRWMCLAGALCAIAMMTKQVAVWNLLGLAGVATVWRWRDDGLRWTTLRPAAMLTAGAALAVALIAIPFAATGSLGELFYANVSYNWLYVGVLSYGERLADFSEGFIFFSAVAAPLVAGAFWGLLTVVFRRKQPFDYLIIVWAAASAAGVAMGGRFFPHYFLHLLPAMAVLTAVVGYERLARRRIEPLSRPALGLALLLVAASLTTNGVLYLAPRLAERHVAQNVYEQKEWEDASQALAQYVKERTGPEDKIFNFGREAQIYFYADRQPAVRYFSDWPFWWDDQTLNQTVAALRLTRPVYLIDSALPPLFPDYRQYHPPVLMSLLQTDYDYVGRIYFADVYRLKGSIGSPIAPGSELNALMAQNYSFQ